jgi:D-beta-D-heptose 7-phosphate kinase / D-beta-D-heptose 1-phosphate adenosyltransferase
VDGVQQVLDAMPGLRVLVLGDALLDEYVVGSAMRMCREGPAAAVQVSGRRCEPGGAANVAANAAALGADVSFLSVVGDDPDAQALCSALESAGVRDCDLVVEPGRRTVVKRRVVVDHQLLLRLDDGEAQALAPITATELSAKLAALHPQVTAVVVSDYGYGTVHEALLDQIAALQRQFPRVLVIDSHDPRRFRPVGATAVKPNYEEVRPLLTTDGDGVHDRPVLSRAERVARDAVHLLDVTGAGVVAVTLDVDGAVVCEHGQAPYRTHAGSQAPGGACGAGDSYTAALALALAAGAGTATAAEVAQAAAVVVTAREGTCVCSADELRHRLWTGTSTVLPLDEVARLVAFHRRHGRRVVFTNGCFDLLHRGHVDLLRRAKALGDVLVVGLNSDRSIQRLKGPDRPVNPLEDRADVLAALGCVDHITAFDDEVASSLVDLLEPDVYVKGGDYTPEMLPEAPHVEAYGGVVRILPYVENRSTTSIIERIRS